MKKTASVANADSGRKGKMNEITLPILAEESCEVLVAGGGTAGCCAALAAARLGKKVVLMDECGVLGGQATLGMVAPISSICDRNGESFGGILDEILEDMRAECAKMEDAQGYTSAPSLLGLILTEKLDQAGVTVHFFTKLVAAEREDRRMTAVIAAAKSGLRRYHAQAFIDATGDADLTYFAGEETVLGSEPGVFDALAQAGLGQVHFEHTQYRFPAPGALQPVSVMFTVGGVEEKDCDLYAEYCNRRFTYQELGTSEKEYGGFPFAGRVGFEKNGDYLPLPQGRFLFFKGARKGEYTVNMSRVTGINGADADSLDRGERDAQLQVLPILELLRRFIPGFEHAYLIQASGRLGVRESRRLLGRRVFHGQEAFDCVPMPDVVAHGSYIIDIHDPNGKAMAIGGSIRGSAYDIPYGALLPQNTDNLWVCGRCISSDHVAHATTRIIGTCMLTGQAVGTAAALCLTEKQANGEIDVAALQRQLKKDGVKLQMPEEKQRLRNEQNEV